MDNLALNKPALQSSVSAWSSSSVAAEAARGGNDGDLSRDLSIHTERERDPWWQVDLQGTYAAEQVHLFNRDAFPERLSRFSVLGSLDGIVWDILASKSDDRVFGPDGEPFVLDLPHRPVLRFLRVRLDGLNCLHFKECRVFGVEAAPDLAMPEDPKRIVFSALYNESDAFLDAYLANFLNYTGAESVLLVNFPPGRTIPDDLPGDRVVVFNGDTRRHKSGHTLLMGHLESYALALQRFGEFDYFCPLASNSLFVRRFDPTAAVLQLRAGHKVPIDLDITYDVGLDIDRLPDNWHWPKIDGNRPLKAFLKDRWGVDRLSQNQIEGLMASRADWSLLHARLPDFPVMGNLVSQEESMLVPLEEILPVTFFLGFGSGRYVNICHVLWNRFNHTRSGRVTVGELLTFDTYPAHLCMMKWFERDARAVETAAVTQPWGQTLLASFPSPTLRQDVGRLLLQRVLIEKIAASMRSFEVVAPFTAGWRSSPDEVLPPCVFQDSSLQAVRQMVHLQTGPDREDAYFYLEPTSHRLDLSATIEDGAATTVRLSCKWHDTDNGIVAEAQTPLEGFLYMRAAWQGDPPVVRFRVPMQVKHSERVMRRIVIMHDGSYKRTEALHIEQADGMTEYHFKNDSLSTTRFWLGIPFFAVQEFEASLDLVQTRPQLN